jgi:hypothetical protein
LSDAGPLLQRLRLKESVESLKATIKTQFSDAYFSIPAAGEQNSGGEKAK